MAPRGTNIRCITGNVMLKQESVMRRVQDSIKIKTEAEAETGPNSFAVVSDNPGPESGKTASAATMFPNSSIIVRENRGYIEEMEILVGLVYVSVAPGKRAVSAVAEFEGTAWIDVFPDGRSVLANGRGTVCSRQTRRTVRLDVNQQVMIDDHDICGPEPMERRFIKAQETMFSLGCFPGAEMYREMSESSDALLDASLSALESLALQTGMDIKELKNQTTESFQKHKRWAEGKTEECRMEAETIKRRDFTAASELPVDRTLQYRDLRIRVISVKRETKNGGTDLLLMPMEVANESSKQIFIFRNEETRLINDRGDPLAVDDYNLETHYMPDARAKGYLSFLVNESDEKFTLQFGGKNTPKTEIELAC